MTGSGMRFTAADGRVYEFGPEFWGQMNLPRDHSDWARSVRWSCGRPGWTYDPVEVWQRSLFEDYARHFRMTSYCGLRVAVDVQMPGEAIKIVNVT